jgi:hypothetical protein
VLRPSSLSHARAQVTALARVFVLALLAAITTVALGPTVSPATAAPRDPDQPLVLKMRSITPDYVPERGPIVVRGTVTNVSDQVWTAINVHGFIGSEPITTADELAEATHTPVTTDVGSRITVPGTFDHIDTLLPGQTHTFVVRLPRSTLGVSAPGVYWFGVHVLGNNGETGASRNAVGRDRTFIPLVPTPHSAPPVDTALVVPVRAPIVHDPDGAVEDPSGWTRSLRSGALHQMEAIGQAANGHALTWLVDPAVADTVRALAHGNPPRTLGTPPRPGATESPSASPSASESATGTAGSASATPSSADERVARRWLQQLRQLLSSVTGEILGLPYGDVAVESASRYDQPLLTQSFRRTGDTLRPWGLPLSSVVAPPGGRTADDVVSALPGGTDVLLHDTGVSSDTPTVSKLNGHRVIVMSSGASQGGPGPVDPQSPLALRQRILSEAALRYLGDGQPLVVELPLDTHHRVGPSFFTGLDVPWLQLTTVNGASAVSPTPMNADQLLEPQEPLLGPRVYSVADRMLARASVLQTVLPGNHVLLRQMFDETATNTSYSAAEFPLDALARVRSTHTWVDQNLNSIDLAAPVSVTLASTSGRFSALVSNNLDVPVTVNVRAMADPRLHITGGETVSLAPHGRTTVLLNATTHVLGVHTVTLMLTNKAGRPLGAIDQFPMRAEQVSQLIWVIIGAGVALLFAAIVIRLVRRILRARPGSDAA